MINRTGEEENFSGMGEMSEKGIDIINPEKTIGEGMQGEFDKKLEKEISTLEEDVEIKDIMPKEFVCQSLYKAEKAEGRLIVFDMLNKDGKHFPALEDIKEDFIVVVPNNDKARPSFEIMEKAKGFIIEFDGKNNKDATFKQTVGARHCAIAGRELGIPVVGLENATAILKSGEKVRIISGGVEGKIIIL